MTDRDPKVVRYILWTLVILTVAIGAGLMLAARAHANQRCGFASEIVMHLTTKYAERLIFTGTGLRGEGEFRIYGSAENGTWTLIGLPVPEMACILVTGVKYLPPRVAGQAI